MRNAILPILSGLAIASLATTVTTTWARSYPPAPVPVENPITEEKRVLGKILFWDEQLSSDNTVACGTCHAPGASGSDPREPGRHPGPDGVPGEVGAGDDAFGSLGVIHADANGAYAPSPLFGFAPQVTPRNTQGVIGVDWFTEQFWDGRATFEFIDPETGAVSLPSFGALESQALAPILSAVEMGHEGRTWDDVRLALEHAQPMQLATALPDDMRAAIEREPSYPQLFAAAFGDPAITAERIAWAIATYERTLRPEQTGWDRFMAGDASALTKQQQDGMALFMGDAGCNVCHPPPLFTDLNYHNLGIRPPEEDLGRFNVTGQETDRGRFKTPTLRNVGLKPRSMHNGQMPPISMTIADDGDFALIPFYFEGGGPFEDNRDELLVPLEDLDLNHLQLLGLLDFVRNGLIDPRVAGETFPFDRPVLRTELAPNPEVTGPGRAGTGGATPRMIAVSPPNLGNLVFKVGVHDALGGATAHVAMSAVPPAAGEIVPEALFGPITLAGRGAGNGYGTFRWPIPFAPPLDGRSVWVQWRVDDAAAPGGVALSETVRIDLFCNGWCPCPEDIVGDANVGFADLAALLGAWGDCFTCAEDLDRDAAIGFTDLVILLGNWGTCAAGP